MMLKKRPPPLDHFFPESRQVALFPSLMILRLDLFRVLDILRQDSCPFFLERTLRNSAACSAGHEP